MGKLRAAGLAAVTLVTAAACTEPGGPPGTTTTTARPPVTATTVPATNPAPNREGFWELTGDVAAHDPSIIRQGDDWYVFTTGARVSVTRSHGGLFWEPTRTTVFPSRPSWWATIPGRTAPDDVWAPDVKAWNGRVWLYYSISSFGSRNSAIGLASALSAADLFAGRATDHGKVLETREGARYNAIDPELVIDATGTPWLAFGSFWEGIKMTELDPATMKPRDATRLHSLAYRANGIEAPAITYRDGYYYLFASIDRCCLGVDSTYKIIYGRSRSVTGPYLDARGRGLADEGGTVLDAGNDRWRGPGGQDVNEGNVLARHAYDATAGGAPKLLINGLRWDEAGWPTY